MQVIMDIKVKLIRENTIKYFVKSHPFSRTVIKIQRRSRTRTQGQRVIMDFPGNLPTRCVKSL